VAIAGKIREAQGGRVEALQLDVAGYLLKPVTLQAFAEVTAALNKCWTLAEMP
jgi:hypothetical protein